MRVLLFSDRNKWIAQCLDHDICTQGDTKEEVFKSIERVILGQIHLDEKHGLKPLQDIPKPPFDIVNLSLRL